MLLDLEFIIKIAEEKIEEIKALQENKIPDPAYKWFQNDPTNSKKNTLMDTYRIIANQISSQTTLEQQKNNYKKKYVF